MLGTQTISTTIMGNRHCTKLIQVFKPTMVFNLHLDCSRIGDGGFETLLDSHSREESGDEDAGEDRMESEEGGRSEATFR